MQLITRKQMQSLDRMAIEKRGIPSLTLMENAGREVARVVEEFVGAPFGAPQGLGPASKAPMAGQKTKKQISIFCGKGNNGGDGLVIARVLHEAGFKVRVYLLTEPENYHGDPLINLNRLPSPRTLLLSEKELRSSRNDILKSSLIIDAIFGTGLDRPIQGFNRKLIQFLNQTKIPICAVDIPSGIDATTGEILGEAISASLTVTFHLPKRGLVLGPAIDRVGELKVVDIGIPYDVIPAKAGIPRVHVGGPRLRGSDKHEFLITPDLFSSFFKPRKKKSHKNDFGHVLTIAGSKRKVGAALMTARAALRTGAGLSTLALPEVAYRKIDRKYSEIMFEPQKDDGEFFSVAALPTLLRLSLKKSVIACGPGMGVSKDIQKIIKKLIQSSKIPLVLDADSLNVLSLDLSFLKNHKSPIVLTPHPGEMRRLLGLSNVGAPLGPPKMKGRGKQRPYVLIQNFSKKYNLYLILKGYRTLVFFPNGDLYVNPTGNPGMATAGAGDILTGILAGLVAQKIPFPSAVLAAVWIHGKAGDRIAKRKGERGIVAWDLAEEVPFVMREISNL